MVSYPGLVMIREWSGENVLGLHAYTFGDREKGSSPFVRSFGFLVFFVFTPHTLIDNKP